MRLLFFTILLFIYYFFEVMWDLYEQIHGNVEQLFLDYFLLKITSNIKLQEPISNLINLINLINLK